MTNDEKIDFIIQTIQKQRNDALDKLATVTLDFELTRRLLLEAQAKIAQLEQLNASEVVTNEQELTEEHVKALQMATNTLALPT